MAGRFNSLISLFLFLFLLSGSTGVSQKKTEEDRGGLVFSGSYTKHSQSRTFSHRLMQRTAFELRDDNKIELPTAYRITQEFSFWRNYGLGDLLNIYIPGHSIKIFANSTFFNPDTEIKLIVNEEPTAVKFLLPKEKMDRNNRHKLIFSIDEAKGEIALSFEGKTQSVITTPLPNVRMKDLRVVDWECPSIILWDMKIEYDGEVRHHWPFFEYSGSVAHDVVGGKHAHIRYPEWAINEYHYWTLADSFAFDAPEVMSTVPLNNSPLLVIVLKDRLYRYDPDRNSFDTTRFERKDWMVGGFGNLDRSDSLLIFNTGYPSEPGIVNIYSGEWLNLPVGNKPEGYLYRTNSIYEASTGESYMVGGYGWYKYHKTIWKFNKQTRGWDTLKLKQNDMLPINTTATLPTDTSGVYYIWGGYGSLTGKQEDGEKNYHDFYRFDLNKETLTRVWRKDGFKDYRFRYSGAWTGNDKKEFYSFGEGSGALNGASRVFRFSIDGRPPVIFDFPGRNDQPVIAPQLVYSQKTGRLYGISSEVIQKTKKQIFKVFALNQPFMNSKEYAAYKEMADEKIASLEPLPVATILLTIGIVAPVGFIAYYILRRRNGRNKNGEPIQIPHPDGLKDELSGLSPGKGFVTIFGGLQIVNEKGKEHHEELSAKLRELLGYLVWYSFTGKTRGKGVTLKRLSEVFWEDVPEENVKNNRNVSLSKIRGALTAFGKLQIKSEEMRIRVELDPSVSNETGAFTLLLRKLEAGNNCTKEDLLNFLAITGRGKPFEGFVTEWADTLSSEISGRVIDLLLKYGETVFNGGDYDLAVSVANVIAKYEKLSEEALRLKIRSLDAKGLHTVAKDVYESFVREYKAFFQEEYGIPLKDLLS